MSVIWVDADACPRAMRDIIIRGAERSGITATFVANHALPLPRLALIKMITVPGGADAADQLIIERAVAGDLAITSDLPMALELIEKDVEVLTARGESLTSDNIRARLNIRDFMETMRGSGEMTGGPSRQNAQDVREFANAFDRALTRRR